jgi:hypothetical protein
MKIFTKNTQFYEYLGMGMGIDTQFLGYWVLGMGIDTQYLGYWVWVLIPNILGIGYGY